MLYFLQDESKATCTLAVAGHDPRGTGHFTYLSTPEMQDVAPPLKCTNRCGPLATCFCVTNVPGARTSIHVPGARTSIQNCSKCLCVGGRAGVLAWLESLGVVPGAPAEGAKVPNVVLSKLPSASHGGPRKPGKRRAADGGAEGPAKRRAKGGHDEGGVSYEVIVSHSMSRGRTPAHWLGSTCQDACTNAVPLATRGWAAVSSFSCMCQKLHSRAL